jgi:crotonobetainyl-CoA:carnitine CoA-transferase CaiB-like acyl-CoA transferase
MESPGTEVARMTKPLDGVRVVEIGSFVFGPVTSAVLADCGADVVKVEHPMGGDPVRRAAAWGVPAKVDDIAYIFEFSNRGKRSVALDVAHPDGYEVFLRLIDTADVFLSNFLAATRHKLRVAPEDLLARNPRLVYARASGRGPRGPRSDLGGFDALNYWVQSGAALSATPPGHPFPLAMPGPGFGDVQSGMALAGGIGMALFRRERTGEGVVVDTSLLGAGLWAMGLTLMGASLTGRDMLDHQQHTGIGNPLVNTYRTSDGRFIALVWMQPDRYWPEFCLTVGREAWLADERFVDSAARRDNADALISLLDELFAERPFEEWCEILSRQEGQWETVNTPGMVLADEGARANGYIQRVDHEGEAELTFVAAPVQFDEEPATITRAPELGAHTDEVLAGIGLTADEIAELRDRGAIG